MERCDWCGTDPLYMAYHDREWGVPVVDDARQFEFLVLESAQAGLSWITILRRRENYRRAYGDFNPDIVASFSPEKIDELLTNPGIIRNRRKVESSVRNARAFLEVQREFGRFSRYLWRFVDFRPVVNSPKEPSDLPARTELSDRVSADLKKRGFSFVGPTIVYAHLQATGLVNDHLISCFRRREILESLPAGKIRIPD